MLNIHDYFSPSYAIKSVMIEKILLFVGERIEKELLL